LEEVFLSFIGELLYLMLVVAVFFVIRYIKQNISEYETAVIRAIVEDGILFVQQVYGHVDGEHKLQRALEVISNALDKKNLKVDEEQLRVMVESILRRLKKDYGEMW